MARAVPFTIRLKDRTSTDGVTEVHDHGLGIDPGSKHTGMAVYRETTTVDTTTGEVSTTRSGVSALVVEHRGWIIKKKLQQRAGYRRRRRSSNMRYRAPRFNNRTKPSGWLPPSLQHRVDTTLAMTALLRRLYPVAKFAFEYVTFDTQLMQDPSINAVQYQQGTLAGYEVREYLLAKFGRQCVYCDATGVPLNIDHVLPRALGGSNRISNLVLSCISCNQKKGALPVEVFVTDPERLRRILAQLKKPLRDAAITQATRNSVLRGLHATGLPVSCGTGGRTKWNRTQNGLTKTHALDALCVGDVDTVTSFVPRETVAKSTGRGQYQRTNPDKHGFPRSRFKRQKQFFGFATGDLGIAHVPNGKYAGTHQGRIAVRATGYFRVGNAASVSHKHVTLIQRNSGWSFTTT